jgi:predicted protein tyrosine phosphatase
MKRILFICDQGRIRSRTAADVVNSEFPQFEARYAGTDKDAYTPVSAVSLYWADIIIVMKPRQKNRLAKQFPSFRRESPRVPIICWHINDLYEYGDERLKVLVREGMYEFVHGEQPPWIPPRPNFSTPVIGGVKKVSDG